MDHPTSFWHGHRAFVVGCSGFLGTWVVRELLGRGASVSGLARFAAPDSELTRGRLHRDIRVVRGSAADGNRLLGLFATHEPAVIFDLLPADSPHHRTVSAAAAAVRTAMPVIVPAAVGLPTVFGPGDRRPDRLVPRVARAVLTGHPVPYLTSAELAEPHLYAADAARGLVRIAEQAATDPGSPSRPVDLRPDPPVTGADLVAALTGGSTRPWDAPGRDSLRTAVAETLTWYRTRPAALPAVRRAA